MNAEKYLSRIAILDERIKNKSRDIERWKQSAEYSSYGYDNVRVQTSGGKSKIEEAIIKSLTIEEKMNRDIKERKEIIATLDSISETHIAPYSVLYKFYVLGLDNKQIALESKKSLSWVRDNKRIGLDEIQKILEERK